MTLSESHVLVGTGIAVGIPVALQPGAPDGSNGRMTLRVKRAAWPPTDC